MVVIRAVASLLVVIMAIAILVAVSSGDFSSDGETILGLKWGVVSLLDIYTGAALFAVWIWWRDGWKAGLAWLAILVALGHLASALYVAWRAWTTDSVQGLLIGPVRGGSSLGT